MCIDIEQKRPNPIRAAKGKNTKLVLLNYAKLHHQQWWLLPNVMKKSQLHQLPLLEICKFLEPLMTFFDEHKSEKLANLLYNLHDKQY